jgi:DNA (cytosine-5)-methyltransferase 1
MNYLSVCSGIEAATVAWHNLNWKAVGYSEIEKFPSEVLHHHYPNVNNFGDMTKYKDWNINESVELLVGGTPCQSFSLAGLRKGLDDPRGNLALVFCGILNHFKPKWFVWENVPGVLSSNRGQDFGSFIGALAKLGYGFSYRVLDAQYFGVAQRRRRVFVVGHFGSWEPAAKVLFERNGLSGNNPQSRKKRESSSQSTFKCFAGHKETEIAATLQTSCHEYSRADQFNIVAECVENNRRDGLRFYGNKTNTLQSFMGTGGGNVPLTTYSIQGNMINRADKNGPNGTGINKNIMFTLNATDIHAVESNLIIRKLTPIECERLQGFPDNYTNIKDNCPDGHRYKALGNSMAVPVMKWIGERINNVAKQMEQS